MGVVEHRLISRRCACGAVPWAVEPAGVTAPVQDGPHAAAIAVYLCPGPHLPVERTAGLRPEHGRLVRTVFAPRYRTDPELHRQVQRQLNKGESLHALRRRLFFAHQGHVRRRHLADQLNQALCLTLLTNAAILGSTVYRQDALDELRRAGHPVTHLSPARDDHLNPYGSYTFDIDADLGPNGRRPLHRSLS